MMAMGKLPILALRILVPYTGAWIAEADMTLEDGVATPTGRQTLTVGNSTLVGTIDPRGTMRFADRLRVRVVAGAGAWDQTVTAQHFQNDAGVSSSQVVTATASQVGETIVDAVPIAYGSDFFRLSGRASAVLDGRQWYVDALGVTQVAAWPELPIPDVAEFIAYNPAERRAELSSNEIVWPGTRLFDFRTGEALVVRTVDQSFSIDGSRATAWVGSSAVDRIGSLLELVGASFAGTEWARAYRYAIKTQVDGSLALQAVNKSAGIPETLPLKVWPGMAGLSAQHTPGTQCSVVFLDGDRTQPVVVNFDGQVPVELELDATTLIKIGKNAVSFAAKALIVDANFTASKTLASALSVYVTAIQAIADPGNTATPVLTAAIAAFLAAIAPTPAVKVRIE